jgi:hypothetical protein
VPVGLSRGRAALLPRFNRAARLLLAGEGEALTRKAVELALAGDPAAQVAVTLCGAMQLGHVIEAYVRGRATEFERRLQGAGVDAMGFATRRGKNLLSAGSKPCVL